MEYIKAYSGSDSYIFISYAHRDTEKVLPIIKNLISNGYRTWYDEGIEPGTSWDDYIAEHVIGCSYFIAFVSPSYLASSNCMDELNFARDENKKLLLVYLEPVELPVGMRMRLNRLQAINKYAFQNENDFYGKLYSADAIDKFRNTSPLSQTSNKNSSPLLLQQTTSAKTTEIKTIVFDRYTYTGEVTDGKANGRGVAVWKNGGKWQGVWKDDKPIDGSGVLYFSNGNIYNGSLKNSLPNGYGKVIWDEGGEWEGEWKEDSPLNGKGTVYFSKFNHRYEGEMKNGKRNGQGTMYWASLNQRTGKYVVTGHWSLSGEWRDNQIWNGDGNSGPEKPWEKFCNGERFDTEKSSSLNDDDFYKSINNIINNKK